MKLYIDIKAIHAKPMSRGDYNSLRGWTIPKDENPLDQGYVIERRDIGHVTWMPKDVFEKIYMEDPNDSIGMVDLKHDLLTTKYTGVVHEKEFKFNAPHLFRVYSLRDPEGSEVVGEVHFQEGPIKENGVNGVCNEDLIAMVICRLEHFQRSEYSSRDNAMAITKLEEAMLWLRKRTIGRENRGVEGTSMK
jgi:hypothetical protein